MTTQCSGKKLSNLADAKLNISIHGLAMSMKVDDAQEMLIV